jgi:hypothetical protein
MPAPLLRTVAATRYVTPLREGGSLPGLVEADDDGLYVLKFRGAGQGPKALVAELLVGELARAVGLTVPEIVLVDLDPVLGDAEPDPEIHALVRSSAGINVGLDFLPGALAFSPAAGPIPAGELAAAVVWLDAFAMNPDRTLRNPNLLTWHGRLWLIDHGAALYVHHTWRDPATHARGAFARIRDHILLPYASSIGEVDARLAPQLGDGVIERIVELVPAEWLEDDPRIGDAAAQRAAYVTYLHRRLEPPRRFVEEAERARLA